MHKEVFQSLHESIRKRNTPDHYVIDSSPRRDVIHRGYLRGDVEFPMRYDFIPDGSTYKNSGRHVYHFRDGNISGVIEIMHTYSPTSDGHETTSVLSFEKLSGSLPEINIHRLLIPTLNHHIKSHDPDIIKFSDGIPFPDDMISRLGSKFDNFKNTMVKKKIDPKITRILSHIKNKLNTTKEN
jgi:hypothetical protein